MTLARSTSRPRPPERATYEGDFYTWSLEQGALMRAGRFEEVDWQNVAEEIESLGRSEFSKLVSFYRLVLLHMLKWDHQPGRRTRSWVLSIAVHRLHTQDVLKDNPGLKGRRDEALARAYVYARLEAADETGLDLAVFPETCPYSFEEVLDRPFTWPITADETP